LIVKRNPAAFDQVVKKIQFLGMNHGKVLEKRAVGSLLRARLETVHD